MRRKRFKILYNILRYTKADRIFLSYLVFVFLDAALIWVLEPTIATYSNALWYCYAVISTAGFGDVTVTAFMPKILSYCLFSACYGYRNRGRGEFLYSDDRSKKQGDAFGVFR